MKVIQRESDFALIESCIDKTIDKSKGFPDNVFRDEFKYYLFIEFYCAFQETLYTHLKQFMLYAEEDKFWIAAVSPDPKLYFRSHFEFYATIEYSISDNENIILSALHDYPIENLADSVAVNTNSIIVSSYTNKWGVYGERDWDIAVCAFTDEDHMKLFKETFAEILFPDNRAAAELAHHYSPNFDVERFCKSYRTN